MRDAAALAEVLVEARRLGLDRRTWLGFLRRILLVGSGLMMFVGGKAQGKSSAMLAAASSLFLGATLLGSERLNVAKPGGMLALAGTGPIVTEETPAGTQGLAALMPEYGTQGLGQIVMQPLNGAYGETVNVAGLGAGFRSDAFGKAPY